MRDVPQPMHQTVEQALELVRRTWQPRRGMFHAFIATRILASFGN